MDSIQLSNGVALPLLGLGVFRIQEGSSVQAAVQTALQVGYRCIDTAALYGNEKGVGNAIKASDIERKNIFLTTKVWNTDQGYEKTLQAFEASRKRLQVDYIDLYLVHWPVGNSYVETWKALEKLYADGKVRAIGVSNFYEHHLTALLDSCEIVPMLNQVELHPMLQLPELRKFCVSYQIQVQAWAPIMRGKVNRITLLRSIGARYNKTPAQVALKWAIQHNIAVIPKSEQPSRIKSNAEIFDFTLSAEELQQIDSLDRSIRLGPHPDSFASP